MFQSPTEQMIRFQRKSTSGISPSSSYTSRIDPIAVTIFLLLPVFSRSHTLGRSSLSASRRIPSPASLPCMAMLPVNPLSKIICSRPLPPKMSRFPAMRLGSQGSPLRFFRSAESSSLAQSSSMTMDGRISDTHEGERLLRVFLPALQRCLYNVFSDENFL
jgi:hypothetical protein